MINLKFFIGGNPEKDLLNGILLGVESTIRRPNYVNFLLHFL